MNLAKPAAIGAGALLLGATYHVSTSAAGSNEILHLYTFASNILTNPVHLSALLAFPISISVGWFAAHKILKRHYQRSIKTLEHRFDSEIRLLDSAIDQHSIVSITDRDGVILKVNRNFEAAFGYASEDVVGELSSILYLPAATQTAVPNDPTGINPATRFQDVHAEVQSGRVWSGEQSLRRSDGEIIHVMSTILPHFDDQGNHIQSVSLRTDITQKRVNETQRQLTRMLEELQDEVFLYDVETLKLSYMNKAALARCEWSAEDVPNRTIADTASDFSVPHFRAHVAPLMDGSRDVVSIETHHEKAPVEVSTRIYSGPNGTPVFLSVLRDTSERKKLQSVKMNTMAMVSHELRTPLTSIKGALRLLQSGVTGELKPEIQGMIDIASRNSDRLLHMVNDILVLEKMNSDEDDFTLEETDLSMLIEEALSVNKGYGDELGVSFVQDPVPARSLVSGNNIRLMQVMTNLMSNAAKYSPKGGTVHVGVRREGQFLRVYVTDNGPGVPEDARATIFDSFTQFSAADGTTRSGTGLGLQICKRIVASHKGRISFTSDPGIETTFYFDLPRLAGAPDLKLVESTGTPVSGESEICEKNVNMASSG